MSQYAANLVASLRAGARLGPNEAARAVLPLAEAVAAEHAHGMVHGPVDPSYAAPEVARGEHPTPASDVWSVGALLFHALSGEGPAELSHETPTRPHGGGWLAPMVEMMLAPDPKVRPDMAEVASYLRARETVAGEPEPTVVLPPPPPPPVTVAGSTAESPVAPELSAAAPAPGGHRRDRRTALLALILLALVVVLGVITLVLVLGGRRDADLANSPTAPPATRSTSPSVTHSTAKPHPKKQRHSHRKRHHQKHHKKPRPKRPTAAQLESFARDYVATASTDPARGIRMLTSAYRQASPDYGKFWSAVSDVRILSLSADPRAMTVTYHYAYTLSGRSKEEWVTLRLVREGGRLLISGAS